MWLFAAPCTVAWQAPLSVGFPRQERWGGLPLPSPGDLPEPGLMAEPSSTMQGPDPWSSTHRLSLSYRVPLAHPTHTVSFLQSQEVKQHWGHGDILSPQNTHLYKDNVKIMHKDNNLEAEWSSSLWSVSLIWVRDSGRANCVEFRMWDMGNAPIHPSHPLPCTHCSCRTWRKV